MKYSFIVPVYNRPDEVAELLQSLVNQTLKDFEVIIVEDGSQVPCEAVVEGFNGVLDVKYFLKENAGPGQARNFGAQRASGDFLLILDSDCVIPTGYLQAVDDELRANPCEAFGGPDRAHESFSPTQKAINYSMTSFFTTGGIRGGKKKLDKFYPRSFNMGVRKDLYEKLGGFSNMRFGEDIDFSIRIFKSGAQCRLFPEAWVWHKRRTDFMKFFRQVHNSGIARINLYKRYPESLKMVHLLPMLFTIGVSLMLLISLAGVVLLLLGSPSIPVALSVMLLPVVPLFLYAFLVFVDSSIRNRSLWIGLLSVRASYTQLIGYGTGFLRAWWLRCVVGRNEELQAFKENFYK